MARPQQNPTLLTAPSSGGIDIDADNYSSGGCGCFSRLCCFGWAVNGSSDSHSYLLHERGPHNKEPSWVVGQLRKLKQFSELVAGPKWKNLIRKFGKICTSHKKHNTQFKYSPEGYALNFSGGGDGDDDKEEDGNLLHSFSSRFAPHATVKDQQRR